jgi:hypothetical protein
VSYVSLGIFASLAGGDYGLWKWSLAGNHQVLAVVFGLALPVLALAFAWLLVVSLWRLFSELSYRRPGSRTVRASVRTRVARGRLGRTRRRLARGARRPSAAPAASAPAERPARKLVA